MLAERMSTTRTGPVGAEHRPRWLRESLSPLLRAPERKAGLCVFSQLVYCVLISVERGQILISEISASRLCGSLPGQISSTQSWHVDSLLLLQPQGFSQAAKTGESPLGLQSAACHVPLEFVMWQTGMASKRSSAVHPINVFSVPLAGPGFQVVMQQPKSGLTFHVKDQEDPIIQKSHALPPPPYSVNEKGFQERIPADCPKGLESLINLEHLFVRQSLLVTEFFYNVSNKFEILTSSGHPFEIAVNSLPGAQTYSWNAKGKEVLKLSGSLGSLGCGSEVIVTLGRKSLGSIEQEGDCMNPVYAVRNTVDKEVARIVAPTKSHCFACGFNSVGANRGLLQFDIFEPGLSKKVGRIARQFESSREEMAAGRRQSRVARNGGKAAEALKLQESELWGLKFPRDTDVDIKALLLSAIFLFEFQYYNS